MAGLRIGTAKPVKPSPGFLPSWSCVRHREADRQPHLRSPDLAMGIPAHGRQVSNSHRSAQSLPREGPRPLAPQVTTS